MLANFQSYYRHDADDLPSGLGEGFPLSIKFGSEISVYFEMETDCDEEGRGRKLLTVVTLQEYIDTGLLQIIEKGIIRSVGGLTASSDGLSPFEESYRNFILDLQQRLDKIATTAAHLLGWRNKIFGFPYRFESSLVHLRWGFAEDTLQAPPFLNRQMPLGLMWLQTPEIWNGKIELDDTLGSEPPLYYELLNDAVCAMERSPKSSLIMFVTALETAIKHYIVQAAPQTEWLIAELQSPPITKLYTKYLQTLPALNGNLDYCLAVPNNIRNKIEKFVLMRNSVVHGKSVSISKDFLQEVKQVVTQITYYIDWLRGNVWAFKFIPDEIKTLIEP